MNSELQTRFLPLDAKIQRLRYLYGSKIPIDDRNQWQEAIQALEAQADEVRAKLNGMSPLLADPLSEEADLQEATAELQAEYEHVLERFGLNDPDELTLDPLKGVPKWNNGRLL